MRVRELEEESRFSHRRLADHGNHLTVPLADMHQSFLQSLHLHVAPHKAGQATGSSRLESTAHEPRAGQLIDIDGLGQSLDRHFSQSPDLNVTLGQTQRIGGHKHAAGIGELLHSGGQVRRLSDGRVLHIEIVADGAHHHLARMETDTDVHREALLPTNFLAVASHGFLHQESREAGANRMIFVGNRRTEKGHDAVSHDAGDRPLILVHCFHHAVDHRIEQPIRIFRVLIGDQLGRTLDVSKQHGDLLALTFEAFLGGKYSLGQMLGRVGLGRAEAGFFALPDRDGLTALQAEPGVRGQLCPALAAGQTQTRSALKAILCPGRIIGVAL